MILVDTSVWIDHFRKGDDILVAMLESRLVATHDFVIGELACGNFHARAKTLGDLRTLDRMETASSADVAALVEQNKLHGLGLGWIDVHLLAAAILARGSLYTKDQMLLKVAKRLGCAAPG